MYAIGERIKSAFHFYCGTLMTMIENLYYGNIAPHEKYIRRGSKLDKAISSLCSEVDNLTSTLTEQQKEVFDKRSV